MRSGGLTFGVQDDPDDVAIVQGSWRWRTRLRLRVVAEGWMDATRSRGISSARRSRRNISPRWGLVTERA